MALLRTEGVTNTVYCIEGEPVYFQLLKENLAQFKNTFAAKTYLGEEDQIEQLSSVSEDGTSKLDAKSSNQISIKKLDTFVEEQQVKDVKLLKTDTDGFDFKVLRGSWQLICKQKPVLFFEYDPDYLAAQKDDGLSLFAELYAAGYYTVLFYDNYGKLLLYTSIGNTTLIKQLYQYAKGRKAAFDYYDVCVFHQDDELLAKEVLKKETAFFANN